MQCHPHTSAALADDVQIISSPQMMRYSRVLDCAWLCEIPRISYSVLFFKGAPRNFMFLLLLCCNHSHKSYHHARSSRASYYISSYLIVLCSLHWTSCTRRTSCHCSSPTTSVFHAHDPSFPLYPVTAWRQLLFLFKITN